RCDFWICLRRTQSRDYAGEGGSCRRSRWCVLLTQKFLSFGRPRHQFTVETNPVRLQSFPHARFTNCVADPFQELRFERSLVEEPASCACVADSGLAFHDAEPFPGDISIAAE